jgi:uncharacterized protein
VAALDGVDGGRVGLWGISQGGWVAPLAAARSRRVAFLVAVSSPGVSPMHQMRYATSERVRRAGYGEDAVEQVASLVRALEEVIRGRGSIGRAQELLDAARAQPWWPLVYLPDRIPPKEAWPVLREEIDFEPAPVFARTRVPTLLFYGESDDLVPVERSIQVWRRARDDVEIVRLPGAGHEPWVDSTISPLYERTLVDWLRARS